MGIAVALINFMEKEMKTSKPDTCLTACDVRHITGIMNEDIIHMILTSGASKQEIRQAYEKCYGLSCTRPEIEKPITPKIHMIQDLIECGHSSDLD